MPADKLIELGKTVSRRLRANPQVQVVEGAGTELFCFQNFLDPLECGGLVAMIDADRVPSTVYATNDDKHFRTSESCNLARTHPFVHAIDAKIDHLLGMKNRQGESLQGQRYAIGQEFKAHHDWFHVEQPYWQDERKRGGQRCWTAMIYLDQPESGGETSFPAAGLMVTPRAGMLLAWNNASPEGKLNSATLHASLPVTSGIKNIVTKWYRERFWC
ncbi:Fe2OG dioxygenase domain-containing protein [Sphingomonas antarctica]|uniref:prolyl hydroxylase family protein n=1 Tax=Sphingomonas antarctica TaxID=2040274 RepID=UPI0039E9C2A1